jgi:polyhydroxyalkanoate synthesis regulator protein
MNTNFHHKNNNRYLILLSFVSVFSAIVFLASYEDIRSVFADSQLSMKDQMNNMMGIQNQNMMMDPSQMQTMREQMNKTGIMMGPMMMMGGQQWPMMGMEPMKMMDPSQMQTMREQMNKTGIMMGPMKG